MRGIGGEGVDQAIGICVMTTFFSFVCVFFVAIGEEGRAAKLLCVMAFFSSAAGTRSELHWLPRDGHGLELSSFV